MTDGNTLFEIDRELDSMLDQIEEEAEKNGTASPELLERFRQFCEAESEKVDRIGRFLTFDGQSVEILPPTSGALSETRAHRRREGGEYEKHGPLLPHVSRVEEDRGQRVHAADAEEQPGFS